MGILGIGVNMDFFMVHTRVDFLQPILLQPVHSYPLFGFREYDSFPNWNKFGSATTTFVLGHATTLHAAFLAMWCVSPERCSVSVDIIKSFLESVLTLQNNRSTQ